MAKNSQEKFQKFCEGMDFADLMRKMKEAKKAGFPFDCAGIMSGMMQRCCGNGKEEEGSNPRTQEE